MSRRTPEEILGALEEAAVDDEMERVLALGEAQRRSEIEAAGADIGALHARADALHNAVLQEAARRRAQEDVALRATVHVHRPRTRPTRLVLLFAAVAALAVPAAILGKHVFGPTEVVSAPAPSAADLRRRALDACARERWQSCLDDLDAARRGDPAGDLDPAIVRARREAMQALGSPRVNE